MSTKNKSRDPGPIRRSLVAAASLLTGKKVDSRTPVTQEAGWQADAEDMYDLVGELRFLADMLAGRARQAKVYIGRVTDQDEFGDPVPVDENDPANVMDLLGGEKNISKMVERYTQNEYVLGEGWVVGVPRTLLTPSIVDESAPTVRISPFTGEGEDVQEGPDLEDMEFRLLSVREIKFTDDDTLILDWDSPASENGKLEVREQDIYSFRIWRAHPMRYLEANSPTRAILPTLRELVGLTMHISAQIDSRLSGAGVFFVLQSAMNAMADGQDGEDLDFITALIDAMVTPIKDRSSAAAVVPLVVPVPDDGSGRAASDYAYLQTFATPFDEKTGELRDEAIRRTALGADAPPEVLLGTGGMNHWGAWLVKEDTITTHVEPPVARFTDGLTTAFLHPVLRAQGMPEERVQEYVFTYSVRHLIVRANRTSDAETLHEAGVISDEALRREGGFDDSDAPEQTDPAILHTLMLIEKDPDLARDPGAGAVLEQMRALLAGQVIDAPETAQEPQEEPGEPGGGNPSEGLPQTQDDDATAPEEDM